MPNRYDGQNSYRIACLDGSIVKRDCKSAMTSGSKRDPPSASRNIDTKKTMLSAGNWRTPWMIRA